MTRLGGYEYWDNKAHSYDKWNEKIVGGETEQLIDRWLLTKVHEGDSVLDLGCGTGRYTEAIADSVARVIAADQSPTMLVEARKKLEQRENLSFQREDCFHTSFEDVSFDVLVLGNLLHIVKSPERVVKEAFRLLRPGGRLLTIDYTGKGMSLPAIMRMIFRILTTWGWPSSDSRSVDPEMMCQIISAGGFEVRESKLLGPSIKAVCLHAFKPAPQ